MKIVYLYDPVSLQYVGAYSCPKSPAEIDQYLVPVHCLEVSPPSIEAGKTIIANDGAWVLVDDVRGVWYKPSGESVVIDDIHAAIEEGWTKTQPILPEPVPTEVSILQAEEALAHFNYLSAVEAIMANPATPENHKRAWRRATSVRRDSAVVAAMTAALSLSESDLDALFTYAAGVEA